MLFHISGIFISSLRLRDEVLSIVLRQNASLSKAFNETYYGISMESIVLQYRRTLKQFVIDLHLLKYPIISFYVDHHLAHNIANHQHISLANTVHTMMVIASEFTHTCLRYTTQRNPVKTSLCGMMHLYNLQSLDSTSSLSYIHRIQVPHLFYVQLQFLEIILVGGWRLDECVHYQGFKVFHYTMFPFSSSPHNMTLAFLFCGSHPPFTALVPANGVQLEASFNIKNTYASCKVRYTALDKLVSIQFSMSCHLFHLAI